MLQMQLYGDLRLILVGAFLPRTQCPLSSRDTTLALSSDVREGKCL